MNETLLSHLGGATDKYPVVLEAQFKRVFDRIIALWGTDEFDPFINSLFINDTGSRQGFPDDAMTEIFRISQAHDAAMQARRESQVWELEAAKRGITELNIECSPHGFTAAVESGHHQAVRLFVQAGFDLEARNTEGWTPLMIAAFFGHQDAAQILIEAGADIRARDKHGYSPIHWAALQGYTPVVALLLTKGSGANEQSFHGITPLIQASAAGHRETVEVLLSRGAEVALPDNEGWTPLHKAVANGHADVVRVLIARGADPQVAHTSGMTCMDIARKRKRDDLLAILAKAPDEPAAGTAPAGTDSR